ncbi:class I SAM-dependent methyltransferase [Pontibacillus salicampi]|uniref:Class I SAM-dependent methyltransferase n=1 Tax=Pontibacillus salicampi TaxID=1449801 RepID=A0ABV6LQC5_9BACI
MELSEFIKRISFKDIQPYTPVDASNINNTVLEMDNTIFPEDDLMLKKYLEPVCLEVPRMSTLVMAGIINKAVAAMKDEERFVNVGVWNGFSFLSGLVNNGNKKCIGIDNFSSFGGPREAFMKRFHSYRSDQHEFYDMGYEEYFHSIHKGPIGFYFYDGPHDYVNQLKGLEIAEPFFSEGSIIMVDDTNWNEPKQATLDFMKQRKDQYEIILQQNTHYNNHPTFWNGIIILKKIN